MTPRYDPIRHFDSLWFRTEPQFRYDLIHEWYEDQKQGDVVKLVKHMWRARKRGAEVYDVSVKDWRRLCERYHNACAFCGKDNCILSVEHIIPISRGGRHSIGNLLPACKQCNERKGSRYITEYYKARWRRKRRKALDTAIQPVA